MEINLAMFSDVTECQTTMKQMQILRFFYFNDDF